MEGEIALEARAKINLGLDVTGIREDGYHLVKMVMQSLDLHDDILIKITDEAGIKISCDKEGIPKDERNLAYKAAKLIMDEKKISAGISIDIKKRIPAAAGLAGGSSDAAAVLKGINELFDLALSQKELMELGLKIGADVPYCIMLKTALAQGIGEKLTRLKDLPKCHILLAKPGLDVKTMDVYKKLDLIKDYEHPDIDSMLEALNRGDLEGICSEMGNVLELVTESEHKEIGELKRLMKDNGALNAMMSGSGPTVFGIYSDEEKAKKTYDIIREKDFGGSLFLTYGR
ncbi:MAG: 4-(cytidine 5'-diphospho)-2-C-methyl-D-erythritol kinase [Lachnospiraceae bacterium]|nr:4-(cytidine 5'-diphospho)-2-C-methyl-D-erythritol kinase [Lachnospiraceae bacterium]